MGDNDENLLKAIKHYQNNLDRYTEQKREDKMLHCIERLTQLPVKMVHLESTGVGRTVNALRKLDGKVGEAAKILITLWKKMVVKEQEQQEEQEQEEQEQDLEEDQGIGGSSEEEEKPKERIEEKRKSSHKNMTEEKIEKTKHKHKSRRRKDVSDSEEEEERNGRHNDDHHQHHHKSKRRDNDEGKQQEKNKSHKNEEEGMNKHKRKHSTSEDEHHKHKNKKKKTDDKKHREKSENKKETGTGKQKKPKDTVTEISSKSIKSKTDKEKSNRPKIKHTANGIDSGSGASFAEALGMCAPSTSKTTLKPKKTEKREKSNKEKDKSITFDEIVPKPSTEPVDINISSLLPPITPNYRPLGNIYTLDSLNKKSFTDYEQLSNIIASKNQRTKVYSGNKSFYGKVPSLFDMCIRILQDNIDALEYTGGVPYAILKPILEKATPNQLFVLEHHNPYLIQDTDELWGFHCQKDFKNKHREEMESYREMYMRCLDEREAKLRALTANIKQSQDKSLPVRTTKLAYVNDVAKPPRNIARKQAKNGTGFDKKPAITPSSRLSSLATSGEAGKVAVPNPGARAAERAGNHTIKPKKAPLMAKSLSLMKNRFRR